MRYITALLLFALSFLAHAVEEGDLLEPEKAFAFSAKAFDANTLEVRYQVANGYYLYRDKFKFEVTDPKAVTLGAVTLPAGIVKQDEFFGKVEIYHGLVTIKLPLKGAAGQIVTLKATAQGCAEAGVCYPPVTQTAKIALTAAAAPSAKGALGALKDIGNDLGLGGGDALLPPDQAFKVESKLKNDTTIAFTVTPSANVYIYKDKFKFAIVDGKGVSVTNITLPKGDEKTDPAFGKTEVYHGPVTAEVTLKREPGAAQKFALKADYQGCNEKVGVCYPPQSKRIEFTLGGAAAAATTPPSDAKPAPAVAAPPAAPAPATPGVVDEESRATNLLKNGSFWVVIASFFGFGLLLAFTPCVFPMIPILSGIIAGQGQHVTKMHGFLLSVSYTLGMAITYAVAGVVAASVLGVSLAAALQNPWVLGTFAGVFVLLSFSMFGFYELQMPNFIQSKFTEASNKIKGGNMAGVFVMGALSAIIVGPCVAAPLAGALLYIAQTKDIWLGWWALFAMALGMGVPLLIVGVAGGALLPRAGAWMSAVKSFFGVLMLGVAIWLITPVIPAVVTMMLWAVLLIVSAIYLHAIDPLPANASGFKKFWKGVGVIALVLGASIAIGALSGSRDILQPLAGLRVSSAVGGSNALAAPVEHGLKFERINSVAELDAKIAAAKGKPVMLDFFADWCVSCKELERFTFNDPKVQARLKDTVLLQADVTANTEEHKALLKRFRLFGPPGIIFFDRDGKEQSTRVIGYQPPEKFLLSLDGALK